jgi:hypothetical protein
MVYNNSVPSDVIFEENMNLTKQAILQVWEKDYKPDPDLTRQSLANDLDISKRKLKRIINEANHEKKAGIPPEKSAPSGVDSSSSLPVGTSIEDNGPNHKVLSYRGSDDEEADIRTIEQLFEYCGLSPDDWIITKAICNVYKGYRADKSKDLVYQNGILSGWTKDSGGINTVPLTQVKAWLTKKEPIAVHPVLQPIRFVDTKLPKATYSRSGDFTRVMTLYDPQFGFERNLRNGKLISYHDRRALSVAWQLAAHYTPDRIIWAGDIFDLAEWSDRFARSPGMKTTMQPAIYEAAWWLHRFKPLTLKQVAQEGNHDFRMRSKLYTHMEHAYDLRGMGATGIAEHPALSIPGLTGMAELGVEWVEGYPDNPIVLRNDLRVTHGNTARGNPGGSVGKLAQELSYNVTIGHIHRHEVATGKTRLGHTNKTYTMVACGCLCKVDGTVPGSTPENNWNQGVLFIDYLDDEDHAPLFNYIPIQNGVAFADGRVFEWEKSINELIEENANEVGFFTGGTT